MSIYLDASFLVSLFVADTNTLRAESFLQGSNPSVVVSDFAAAEFISAVGRLHRVNALRPDQLSLAVSNFDVWRSAIATPATTTANDVATADAMLRRFDLPLRTPDALNLAIAGRVGAELATFDLQMAASAAKLGLQVAPL